MKEEKPYSINEYFKIFLKVATSKKDAYENPILYEGFTNLVYGREKVADDICSLFGKYLPAEPDFKTTILEEASGPGVLAIKLARNGYRVIATDIEPKALERIEEKNQENLPIYPVSADINNVIPIRDNCVDGAIIVSANRYIEDIDMFLSEIRRVLKPNGIFIWPFNFAGSLLWKIKSGANLPTSQRSIVSVLESKNFEVLSKDKVPRIKRDTESKIPFYAIPTYLISKKV